jgi:hypothetical protein
VGIESRIGALSGIENVGIIDIERSAIIVIVQTTAPIDTGRDRDQPIGIERAIGGDHAHAHEAGREAIDIEAKIAEMTILTNSQITTLTVDDIEIL